MSRVSVFIPCYNYAHFLEDCIESVVTQDGADVRILIIDDASSDNTEEICADLTGRDTRIDYVRHSRNMGHIATYNEGIDWADGDYTILLSADDMLAPGALKRATSVLDEHPNVGFVYGPHFRFETKADLKPSAARSPSWRVHQGMDWLAAVCRSGVNAIASPEVVTRTSLQKQLGGYKQELPHSADMEMWLRFAIHSDVGEITDALQAYYRIHDQAMHALRYPAHRDVAERRAAFSSILTEFGDRIPLSAHRAIDRSMARASLGAINIAYDSGDLSGVPVGELRAYARGVYSGTRRDLPYIRKSVGYHLRRMLGPKRCARVHVLRTRRNWL